MIDERVRSKKRASAFRRLIYRRHQDRKSRALAEFAFDADRPAMRFDDGLDDGKTQPERTLAIAMRTRARTIRSVKSPKYFRHIFFRNSDARIRNAKAYFMVGAIEE